MKIVLISGLSGSGKSVTLKLLEDMGYYCIDNLPIELLPYLMSHHLEQNKTKTLAISVDIRSRVDLAVAKTQIDALRAQGHQVEILFLEANESVLVRRFSETRRSHPLVGPDMTLLESLNKEREWLSPLREVAYCIDSSQLTAHQLRARVRQWLSVYRKGMLVILQSFGFKFGVPTDVDYLFDIRCLPNPYYNLQLRPFTGKDKEIQDYLSAEPLVEEMYNDISQFLLHWLPRMQKESRTYVAIGIGCTGGQHRSVYMVERLAANFSKEYETLVRHRQLQAQANNADNKPRRLKSGV